MSDVRDIINRLTERHEELTKLGKLYHWVNDYNQALKNKIPVLHFNSLEKAVLNFMKRLTTMRTKFSVCQRLDAISNWCKVAESEISSNISQLQENLAAAYYARDHSRVRDVTRQLNEHCQKYNKKQAENEKKLATPILNCMSDAKKILACRHQYFQEQKQRFQFHIELPVCLSNIVFEYYFDVYPELT